MSTTAIIGAGVMGETLLSGLIRAGRPVSELLVGEKRPERAQELVEKYAVSVVSNVDATKGADTIALVVKPQDMGALLDEIAPAVRPGQLVVSLAAGITTAFLESRLPDGVAVVRVMPNTPALVDEAPTATTTTSPSPRDSSPRRAASCGSRRSRWTPSPRSPAPGRRTSSSSSSP